MNEVVTLFLSTYQLCQYILVNTHQSTPSFNYCSGVVSVLYTYGPHSYSPRDTTSTPSVKSPHISVGSIVLDDLLREHGEAGKFFKHTYPTIDRLTPFFHPDHHVNLSKLFDLCGMSLCLTLMSVAM